MEGNVYLNGARPSKHEKDPLIQPKVDPALRITEMPDGWYLQIRIDKAWSDLEGPLVTSGMLGKAIIPDLPFEQPDRILYRLNRDYFGTLRNTGNPYPGAFIERKEGKHAIKLWPGK
jgi:alpha-N-arabinofuranosidase